MQGDKEVIEYLNAQLTNELTAINQYFLHARMLENWGLNTWAEKEKAESIGEMHHADALIKRILMLDGLPNVQRLGKITIGQNTEEILHADYSLEIAARQTVVDGLAVCEAKRDFVSREVFEMILRDTEEHIDWLETQIELVKRIGMPLYEQAKMDGHTSD